LLTISFLFIGTKIVLAYSSFGGFFGGKILSTKAIEIETLEGAGYLCYVPGTSISISTIGSPPGTPMNYFIPYSTISKTGNALRTGQLILGRYGGIELITCFHESGPSKMVSLERIDLFGTSR